MGAELEHYWRKLGPELERTFIYGEAAERDRSEGLFEHNESGRATHKLAQGPQGREFLQSKKMQELKILAPDAYAKLISATEGIAVGSCADCEHCRRGVKIEKTDE